MSLDLQPIQDQLAERRRGRPDMQVATMTLAVLFEEARVGGLARERIHALAAKHPCRVIVLDGTQNEGEYSIQGDDWVELGVKKMGAETLRSVVAALRVPDAPVVLLWIAPGIEGDARFEALSQLAQTVVYNSSLLDVGDAAMRQFIAYARKHPDAPIADIAYLRLEPWQESVAIFFDDRNAVDELFDLRRVEITGGSDPEAFYLLGWLASRLNWTPSSADAMSNRFGTRIDFVIRREGEPRRIARVALSSSRSQFVAEADPASETIRLSVTGSSEHRGRYRAINNPGIAALVERAILWGHDDRVFHESLVAVGEILTHRKG